jgi:uncharacterized membrane protein HdeD (DUF308 family)
MAVAGIRFSWRWVALVLRGVVAFAAGIAAFEISADAAKALLIGYFVADGVLALVLAARLHVPVRSRVLVAADGVVDLAVAVLLLAYAPSVPLLILIVSLWAIATGLLEVLAAVLIPRITALSWGIALAGVASCAFGIATIDWTNFAEIGLLYVFAVYAIIAGVLFVTLGIVVARALHVLPAKDAPDEAVR